LTLQRFGIQSLAAFRNFTAAQASKAGRPLPAGASPLLADAIDADLPAGDLDGWALRLDLLALLDQVRILLPETERPRSRLLLLIDNVYLMTPDAVSWLLNNILGELGLRESSGAAAIRIVLTYTEQAPSAGEFRTWRESQNGVMIETLDKFDQECEAPQAYTEFLLFWRENNQWVPLVPAGDAELQKVLKFLAKNVDGVPSYLRWQRVEGGIEAFRSGDLIEAKDEDLLDKA